MKVTFRTRNQEFEQFFKTVGYFTYCKDIDGLMDEMHMRHSPEQWRPFTNASKTSLGTQIRRLFKDQQFEAVLSDKEKAAWQSFEKFANGFLGNFKAENFRVLVQDPVDSYERLGCNMSL